MITEELVGISELNSSCSFQTERDLTLLKPKKSSLFFTSLPPKHESMKVPNLSQKALKLASNHIYIIYIHHIYIYIHMHIHISKL